MGTGYPGQVMVTPTFLDPYLNPISMGETEEETIGFHIYLEIIIF